MKICFVIPTYNDEASLKKLIDNINKELKNFTLNFVIVDDCSQDDYKTLKNNQKIDLIKLDKNQGSQKAITVGLKYVKDKDLEFKSPPLKKKDIFFSGGWELKSSHFDKIQLAYGFNF